MRILPLLLVAAAGGALDGVSVGQWNGMLMVSAPAASDIAGLGGRLTQKLTLDAREQPLAETAAFLRDATGLNVVVAPALLAKPPLITLQVRDMALGSVLRWIERTAGIHAGFVHGALWFSDQPIAAATTTRIYDVRDLRLAVPDFPGPELAMPRPGGAGGVIDPIAPPAEKPRYELDELQALIERFVLAK